MTATYTHLVDLRRELERTQQAMAKAKETFDAEAPEPGTQKHALDTVAYDILMNLQQYFAEHYRRALTEYVTEHNFLLPPESQESYVLPSQIARSLRDSFLPFVINSDERAELEPIGADRKALFPGEGASYKAPLMAAKADWVA